MSRAVAHPSRFIWRAERSTAARALTGSRTDRGTIGGGVRTLSDKCGTVVTSRWHLAPLFPADDQNALASMAPHSDRWSSARAGPERRALPTAGQSAVDTVGRDHPTRPVHASPPDVSTVQPVPATIPATSASDHPQSEVSGVLLRYATTSSRERYIGYDSMGKRASPVAANGVEMEPFVSPRPGSPSRRPVPARCFDASQPTPAADRPTHRHDHYG